MYFDQHVHPEFEGGFLERMRDGVGNARHDDENGVGAPGTRFVNLIGIEQKILA